MHRTPLTERSKRSAPSAFELARAGGREDLTILLLSARAGFTLAGADYGTVRTAIARPFNAVALVAFLIAMFWHAQLGLQVIIEDYVHTHGLAIAAQLAVRFVCALAAIASVLAVVRIALGAV